MFDAKPDFSGMTVNERLLAKGLILDFDRAVANRDARMVRSILRMVDVDEKSVSVTIAQLGIEDE